MNPNAEDRRPPLTPQLALRVAVAASVALALFAIVFFRLWFLQVLSGDQYLAQAKGNPARTIDIPAPRGQIVDRSGNVLVDSKSAIAVDVSPADLPVPLQPMLLAHPPRRDAGLYNHLAHVLGMSTKRHKCPIDGYGVTRLSPIGCAVAQGYAQLPYQDVTIKTDVPKDVQYYLAERQQQFPGVSVQQIWLRRYPLRTLAAQLFGTVGRITPQEVHEARYRGVSQNAIVGQSGLEWYYDHYLRGQDGAERVQVDALGHFTGDLATRKPVQGHSLKLSLDVSLQRAGQIALQNAINANPPAQAGAFVAMNPDNGEVYAMGSLPTFNPNIFTKPVSAATYKQLNNASSNFPLINRAIMSAYPTGSTFKPITATAALESGAWSVGSVYDDTGQYCIDTQCRHNAGNASYGVLNLTEAIKVSSDVFFYNLGALTNADPVKHPNGGALQHWARLYGIGQKTGIDLGGETAGNLPSPRWRARVDREEVRCEHKHHIPSCGIADGRPWSVGDNVNLAVGQGDVQVTPLQLAVAYSAIANGGTVVRPHIGLEVDTPDGTVLQKIQPPAARHISIAPEYLDAIRMGLREAASQPGGTSADVMSDFPLPVYGKTGTAQRNGQADQSWYACFVPDTATSKPIEVIVTVEQGGFGAAAAAPAARQILSQWFTGKMGPFKAGASKTL
ncbi:MAG: penicillin-binding protein 2 [Solirubrobacteraceae bacterium]